MQIAPEIHAKFWPCTKNQKLCKKHQKFTQNMTLYYESKVMQKAPEIHAKYDPVLRIKSYEKNTRNSRNFTTLY